jgi:hypothetical protein
VAWGGLLTLLIKNRYSQLQIQRGLDGLMSRKYW